VKEFSEDDKSDWLPGTLVPERDGVYERRFDDHTDMSRFEGGLWYRGDFTVDEALCQPHVSNYQADRDNAIDFEWRGLKANPNVVASEAPGLALDSGEFIPAVELNAQAAVDDEEQLF
jgi:hypothetical protein